jgi:hypothetical protein
MCGWSHINNYELVGTLWFKGVVPSQNDIGANDRLGWKYRQWRKSFYKQFEKQFSKIKKAKTIRHVVFTRYYGLKKRAYDYGNLVGGLKPALDVIKNVKRIIDDSPAYVVEHYRQLPSGHARSYLTVEIYEQRTVVKQQEEAKVHIKTA